MRRSKTVSGTRTDHIWDGANIALDITGAAVVSYVRGIGLIASKTGTVFAYYVFNARGDVVQLTNNTGVVTRNYRYDAFGNEIDIVATDTNPFRFCGEYYDKETGNYLLRFRYYSPKIGRFTQEDPIRDSNGGSFNFYTYCANNPIMFIDPSGLAFILAWSYGKADLPGFRDGMQYADYDFGSLDWDAFTSTNSFARAAYSERERMIARGISADDIIMKRIDIVLLILN
jgi:RHS repeat-associated protein